jgi:hypothetical protein
VIGDAINVAQRVMDFAAPNQLLVSRSYFDVVSCVSENYSTLFNYLGTRADKHVRQHAVYEVMGEMSGGGDAVETDALVEVAADPAPAEASEAFSEAVLDQITRELAGHIGPMARIVVKKAARDSASLDDLYRVLAEDLPTEEQKRQFLNSRRALP